MVLICLSSLTLCCAGAAERCYCGDTSGCQLTGGTGDRARNGKFKVKEEKKMREIENAILFQV